MTKSTKRWVLIFGAILAFPFVLDKVSPSQYEVLSVSNGAVQLRQVSSGFVIELQDESLVQKALTGEIKQGDLVTR